jgi:putative oxidoreductase
MKELLHPALGIFALRVALGAVFLGHGAFKVLVLTLEKTAGYFAAHGFPGWSAYPVFALEVVGGALLLLGLGSRWAALALMPVATGAFIVHWPNGWYFGAANGGWEYVAFLVVALFAQAALGDGAFALGSRWKRDLGPARSDFPRRGSSC